MITYPLKTILNLLWIFKFTILSILLIFITLFQYNTIKKERLEHTAIINSIEKENLKIERDLLQAVRKIELDLNNQIIKNSNIKKEKDNEVSDLNNVIVSNNDSLQQLAKEAIKADKRQCTDTVTTEIVEKIVRVPAPKGSGELTAEMANDFQKLSAGCATNYEKLKNEAVELESWSEAVVNTQK